MRWSLRTLAPLSPLRVGTFSGSDKGGITMSTTIKSVRQLVKIGYIGRWNPTTLTVRVYLWVAASKRYASKDFRLVNPSELPIEKLASIVNGRIVGKQMRLELTKYENGEEVVRVLPDLPTHQTNFFELFGGKS